MHIHSLHKLLHRSSTGTGVDKFCLIRSHIRSRSQFYFWNTGAE